ncbi:hypothetical protein MJT46_008042 [Ovis ammon polii x Ovis aries]|nr:hypothetical protein MJT46_008042 [Ovis ammon polii x Ovis aries]
MKQLAVKPYRIIGPILEENLFLLNTVLYFVIPAISFSKEILAQKVLFADYNLDKSFLERSQGDDYTCLHVSQLLGKALQELDSRPLSIVLLQIQKRCEESVFVDWAELDLDAHTTLALTKKVPWGCAKSWPSFWRKLRQPLALGDERIAKASKNSGS